MVLAAVLASLAYFCAGTKMLMRQSCCSTRRRATWASDCYV